MSAYVVSDKIVSMIVGCMVRKEVIHSTEAVNVAQMLLNQNIRAVNQIRTTPEATHEIDFTMLPTDQDDHLTAIQAIECIDEFEYQVRGLLDWKKTLMFSTLEFIKCLLIDDFTRWLNQNNYPHPNNWRGVKSCYLPLYGTTTNN